MIIILGKRKSLDRNSTSKSKNIFRTLQLEVLNDMNVEWKCVIPVLELIRHGRKNMLIRSFTLSRTSTDGFAMLMSLCDKWLYGYDNDVAGLGVKWSPQSFLKVHALYEPQRKWKTVAKINSMLATCSRGAYEGRKDGKLPLKHAAPNYHAKRWYDNYNYFSAFHAVVR